MHIRHLFVFAFLIVGCNESHLTLTMSDSGVPVAMGDAFVVPSVPDAGTSFYEWPDSGPAPAVDAAVTAPDAYAAPDAGCLAEDIPYDGLDNDCDGWIDDTHSIIDEHAVACRSDIGCFWFCEPWEAHGDPIYGFHGCCTSGRFPQTDHPEHGMLVRGSNSPVYYIADDGRRYLFASTNYLASWFLEDVGMDDLRFDAQSCRDHVMQTTDEILASIPLGGNVPMRPGVTTTGIIEDSTHRWAIDHGNALRLIDDPSYDLNLAAPWLVSHEIITPDFLFVNFVVGTYVTDTYRGVYDGQRIYDEATLDGEIHAYYDWMR